MIVILSIILIVLISILVIVVVTSLDSFREDIIRIDEAYTNIDNVLNKRYNLISKSVDVIKNKLNKENINFKSFDEIKDQKLDNFTLDKKIYKCIKEFHNYSLDNTELRHDDEYNKIEIDLIESEAEIIALKQYYNDLVDVYNGKIDKFPTSTVAKAKNYEIKNKFEIIESSKLISELK